MVTFRTEGPPCSCGLRPRGLEISPVRVNKRSLRTTGLALCVLPWQCVECLLPLAQTVARMWLDPADAVKVDAYRARRWPAEAAS